MDISSPLYPHLTSSKLDRSIDGGFSSSLSNHQPQHIPSAPSGMTRQKYVFNHLASGERSLLSERSLLDNTSLGLASQKLELNSGGGGAWYQMTSNRDPPLSGQLGITRLFGRCSDSG